MTEFDILQPGTPAFLVEGSTTPQADSVLTSDNNNTELEKLRIQLSNDPSNYPAWLQLIKLTESTDKIDDINKVYDDCLRVFPEDDSVWVAYAEYHLNKENRSKVEEIFKSCINLKSLKLWDLYLKRFVVKYNNLISGGRLALGNIIKAHEFALVDVGIDLDADTIYDHEIQIVNSFSAINEDQNVEKKKIILNLLRKAVKAPTKKIQQYWNQYVETCSKDEISYNSAEYMKVKSFVGQLKDCIDGLDRNFVQLEKKVDEKLLSQLSIYQKWIAFEKENKMDLPADLLAKRIEYAYVVAMRSLRFIPELWIDYSQFKSSLPVLPTDKGNHLLQILKTGFAANPTSFSLAYSIAEEYELDNKTTEAKETYELLISSLMKIYELNNLEIENISSLQIDEIKRKEAELKARRKQEMENNNNNNDDDDDDDMGESVSKRTFVPQIPSITNNVHYTSQLEKLHSLKESFGTAITLSFCSFMRFIKRNYGYLEAREIFKLKKRFPDLSWHFYATSAEIELENNFGKVAAKVYELAMKKSKYQTNIDFILNYLNFLFKVNDKTNSKALFETSVKNFEGDDKCLKTLYLEYIKAENISQNDISTIKNLEKRFLKRFPDVKLIDAIEERFKAVDYDPVKQFDYYGGFDKYFKKTSNGVSKKRKLDGDLAELVNDINIEDVGNDIYIEEEGPTTNEPFVQDEMYNLLRILPKPSLCQPSMFNEKKLVSFLRNLD